jgi:hypothetical protein
MREVSLSSPTIVGDARAVFPGQMIACQSIRITGQEVSGWIDAHGGPGGGGNSRAGELSGDRKQPSDFESKRADQKHGSCCDIHA